MHHTKSHLKPYILPDLPEVTWAYIAGILDGESNIRQYWVRDTSIGKNYGFDITVVQSKPNNGELLLTTLKKWLKTGKVSWKSTYRKGFNQDHSDRGVYLLRIGGRIAIWKILEKIRPYLIVKATVTDKILLYLSETYGQTATHG